MNLADLPSLNAALNATSAVLVVAGLICVKRRAIAAHKACMVAALAASAVFLFCYLYYHAHVGSVRFQGQGLIRPVYFTILLTHTVLAVAIVPLVLRTVWLGVTNRLAAHRSLARWTAPLWLYVSVTGVVVYWLLYRSGFSA